LSQFRHNVGFDDDHTKRLVIELNLKRRHLNTKQRGLLAELLLKLTPRKLD
jgi:hypothetical protein